MPRRRLLMLGGAAAAWWLLGARTSWALPRAAPGPASSGPSASPAEADPPDPRLQGMTRVSSGPWRLLSDADHLLQSMLLQVLPNTLERVGRWARTLGLQPAAPGDLRVLLFAERERFLAFGRDDGFDDPWALGYYSPTAHRCVLCAPAETPGYRAAAARLHGAPASAAVAALRDRLSDWTRSAFLTTATHEAAHQSLFACQVQRRGAEYPAWLSEGMACAFETERLHGDAGPHMPQPLRRERLLDRMQDGDAMPLQALVAGMSRPRGSEAEVTAWYDQSALFTAWLATCRRTELARYLELHARTGMPPTVRTRLEAFTEVVGDAGTVERAWRLWLRPA